jgi:hypothetical protein
MFGVRAAREAWNDAGLRFGEPRAGVIIGSGGGGIDVGEQQYKDFFTNDGRHVTPYAIALGICGMVSSEISIALGLRGISHVLSTGCTSSTDALGYAAGTFRLEVTGGRGTAMKLSNETDAAGADLALDVADLGSLLLGAVSPVSLAAAGVLQAADPAAPLLLRSMLQTPRAPHGITFF